ncbi:MAG TPA: ATP-binding protein [Candidatus Hydrogenedentes bacterium]|nr:ATP-binding protein [Candidatus Hydrogenedentota bacterium]
MWKVKGTMAEYDLIYTKDNGVSEQYPITAEGLLLGRGSENHIIIHDSLVSRRHARVWLEKGLPQVEDLGSRNGILVNGETVRRASLQSGDRITLGQAVLEVHACTGSSIGHAVISQEKAAALHDSILGEASGVRLPVLYRAAQLLGTVFDLDELLRKILALIFEALPVRRGFMLILNTGTNEPEIHAILSKEKDEEGPPLSRTLIQHVFEHRESMLTLDAQDDSRFTATESIMGHSIHAAMCVPLLGHQQIVVGAVYVDSGSSSQTFSMDDLEMLTSIARVVGVAVENARLYRENVEKERLAAIGQATAGLGHCIKNILTGIRGGGEFMSMALQSKELRYVEKGWPILKQSIDRIDLLVMNMMSFSKPRTPNRQPNDLNALVQEVLEVVGSRAERHNVELEFTPGDPVRAMVDGPEIFRVILNLVTNAVDVCEIKGGKVTIECVQEEGDCRLCVSDTGPGIPPEMLPQLFKVFSSSKGSKGTGLGLACSQKIVQEHGGTIEARNEPGSGAVFTVVLPNSAEAKISTQHTQKVESDDGRTMAE